MKPNQRQLIYTLIRTKPTPCVIDSFATWETCDNRKDEYAQQCRDRKLDGFEFEVAINCYYDE